MIDPQYDPLHKQAQELQYKFQDFMGGQHDNHPQAYALHREMHELTNDLESKKNPHDIEHRIKAIQHGLLEAQYQDAAQRFLNPDHSHYLHHNYEQMRRDIRNLPHY